MKLRMNLAFLLLFAVVSAGARVSLPAIFGNNMVLQQQSSVALWGKARADARLTVTTSWDRKQYETRVASDGRWKLHLNTPRAGGPYSITLNDGERTVLQNILIGEVWICSGQSNMQMPLKGFLNQPVLNATDLLLEADNKFIRLFTVPSEGSRVPVSDVAAGWEESTAKTANGFSAVGFQFAQILQKKLGVPVGIINSSWGGTMIEAWMSKESLHPFPEVVVKNASDTAKIQKNDPTVLFNGMIHPIAGFAIKGVIWYQGEQNRANPALYQKLMPAMVKEWRRVWGIGDWPFYYVQIAPYNYPTDKELVPYLREAQQKAGKDIPNSGMVVSMDAGDPKIIHPADKTTISKRLALWALVKTYGWEGLPYASPVFKKMTINGPAAELQFEGAPNGLSSFGKELAQFEIAGEDKIFYPADAKISKRLVIVKSEHVKKPVAVRYAFKDWAVGDLYSTEGLPAAPFRTDNWQPEPRDASVKK